MSPTRLSPLDTAFLAVETPTAHMHVGWVAVFDPPASGPRPDFTRLRDHIASRLHRAPRYRQKLREVPLGLGAPVWVDDPNFDICRHVVRASSGDLRELVDESLSEPLPRDRPLWQISFADRLEDGRIGMVGKLHHCMVDGIAAVELGSLLLDQTPETPEPEPDDWRPEPEPASLGLLVGAARERLGKQLELARLPGSLLGSERLEGLAEQVKRGAGALADAVRPAARRAPFSEPSSPLRQLGLLPRPLDDLRRIKAAFGVKLNDVVLAVAAGGVRRFLLEREEDPMALKAMVPVNVRGDEDGPAGNRISFMFVDLPCDEPEPLRRLRDLHAATAQRKQAAEPEGADAVVRSLRFAPAAVQRLLSKFVASPRVFNLVVSNIPGPPDGLYMHGCPLQECFPVVPLADRHALSIGFTTVGERGFFGLYADRETLPDVDELATYLDEAIDELLELADGAAEHEPTAAAAT